MGELLNGFPTREEYVAMEFKTLDYFSSEPLINEYFENLYSTSVHLIKGRRSKEQFSYHASFEAVLEGQSKYFFVGEKIAPTPPYESTAFFAISDKAQRRVLRKFHFDGLFHGTPRDRPVFHFQSPGEATPEMKKEGFNVGDLEPDLSIPRLVSLPMTLALLVDYLFRESSAENIGCQKVCRDPHWRGIVNNNEAAVLKPYFETCATLSRRSAAQNLIADYLYGK